MEDLIKALSIFLKYGNPEYPTHCEHDVLYVCGIDAEKITKEDRAELETLGFYVSIEGEVDENGEETEETEIYSYKYGSC